MAGFKKVKKKVRKIRKKPKKVTADDLIPLEEAMQVDHGSRSRVRYVFRVPTWLILKKIALFLGSSNSLKFAKFQ